MTTATSQSVYERVSTCRDCGQKLPAHRAFLYCERDRARRQGVSWLKSARRQLILAGRLADAAFCAELIERAERVR